MRFTWVNELDEQLVEYIFSAFNASLESNDSKFIDYILDSAILDIKFPELRFRLKLNLKRQKVECFVNLVIEAIEIEKTDKNVCNLLNLAPLARYEYWQQLRIVPLIRLLEKSIKRLADFLKADFIHLLRISTLVIRQVVIASNILKQYALNRHTGPPTR